MEIVSGFFLWLLVDVFGMKTVRRERNIYVKVLKTIIFSLIGFVGIALFFTVFSPHN
ncbi:MAG: hypothetical protein AAGI07_12505 [Bacteroidota bacterium]